MLYRFFVTPSSAPIELLRSFADMHGTAERLSCSWCMFPTGLSRRCSHRVNEHTFCSLFSAMFFSFLCLCVWFHCCTMAQASCWRAVYEGKNTGDRWPSSGMSCKAAGPEFSVNESIKLLSRASLKRKTHKSRLCIDLWPEARRNLARYFP